MEQSKFKDKPREGSSESEGSDIDSGMGSLSRMKIDSKSNYRRQFSSDVR